MGKKQKLTNSTFTSFSDSVLGPPEDERHPETKTI